MCIIAGTDVSIVTFSKMVGTSLEAAEMLAAQGISAEVKQQTKKELFFFVIAALLLCARIRFLSDAGKL